MPRFDGIPRSMETHSKEVSCRQRAEPFGDHSRLHKSRVSAVNSPNESQVEAL